MTAKDFIRALKAAVHKGAVDGTIASLQDPPGRRPDPRLIQLSHWFNGLQPEDRKMVAHIASRAADLSTYIFLLMLDGLKPFEIAGPKGRLELYYSDSDGKNRVRLNDDDADPLTVLFKELD